MTKDIKLEISEDLSTWSLFNEATLPSLAGVTCGPGNPLPTHYLEQEGSGSGSEGSGSGEVLTRYLRLDLINGYHPDGVGLTLVTLEEEEGLRAG